MKSIYLTQNNRVLCFTHSVQEIITFLEIMDMVIVKVQDRGNDTYIMEVHQKWNLLKIAYQEKCH